MSSSEGNSKAKDQQPTGQTKTSKFSLKSSMLRPSSFSAPTATETSNITNESSEKENASGGGAEGTTPTYNPFKNVNQSLEEDAPVEKEKTIEPGEESPHGDNIEKKPDPLTPLTQLANGMPKSSLFSNVTSTISENSGFVFGQNVHERVIVENKQPTTSGPAMAADNLFSASGTSSGSVGLFSSSNEASAEQKTSENGEASKTDGQSLIEAARKYEESRGAQKRKYEEVETVTGEEDERNILEINCKLFAFAASNYEERGRGTLRLNDSKKPGGSSRVVFRTSGVLRVLMNTKIWAGMIAEPASQKSLRLTAIDNDGHIKVFLVMARPDDINQLHSALTRRINVEKQKSADSSKSSDKTEEPSPKKAVLEAS